MDAPQAGHSTKREPSSALAASGALRRAALCSFEWLFLAACHQLSLLILVVTRCGRIVVRADAMLGRNTARKLLLQIRAQNVQSISRELACKALSRRGQKVVTPRAALLKAQWAVNALRETRLYTFALAWCRALRNLAQEQ